MRLFLHEITPWKRILAEKANSLLASLEVTRLLWNPKVHYSIYKTSTLGPLMSQINSVNILISYFFKIVFNITFTSMLWSTNWFLPFRF